MATTEMPASCVNQRRKGIVHPFKHAALQIMQGMQNRPLCRVNGQQKTCRSSNHYTGTDPRAQALRPVALLLVALDNVHRKQLEVKRLLTLYAHWLVHESWLPLLCPAEGECCRPCPQLSLFDTCTGPVQQQSVVLVGTSCHGARHVDGDLKVMKHKRHSGSSHV